MRASIRHSVRPSSLTVPLFRSGSIEAAVAEAHMRAKSGDTVLLAPACASFDQFENFEQRGHEFKRLVHALSESGAEAKHG